MAVVGVADQYLILVSITLLLTILSIAWRESLTLSVLAVTSWLSTALGSFSVGDQTSPLTTVLAYVSVAFTVIFATRTTLMAADSLSEKKRKRLDVVFE